MDPEPYYKELRKVSPAPYAAFLDFDAFQICSSSMERFLKITKDHIETKPIKGTLPRGKNEEEDRENIGLLKENPQYFAKNVMIVDLLRNHLGKICKVNSVQVPKYLSVETFSTLHQLVSTVVGKRK
ncbi:MAG: chorismate-binding protein [Tissierellia bacterium]|nr:chorismate-binding protein [Tissierellia bacterium]